MTLSLDLLALCDNITTLASHVAGIRKAFNYDEWPERPPGMANAEQAYHFTGMPGTDGTSIRYNMVGMDLSEYVVTVPLYCLVVSDPSLSRSMLWAGRYPARYFEYFRDRLFLGDTATGLANAVSGGGLTFDGDATLIRSIPNYPGFENFTIWRIPLTVHSKGQHTNAPSG